MHLIWKCCAPLHGLPVPNPSRSSRPVDSDLDAVFRVAVGGDGWHTKARRFNADLLQTAYNCSKFNDALFVDARGNPMRDVGEHVGFLIECATGLRHIKEKKLKKMVHTLVAAMGDPGRVKLCNTIHDHTDRVGSRYCLTLRLTSTRTHTPTERTSEQQCSSVCRSTYIYTRTHAGTTRTMITSSK